jgi:hypothetical protein
MTFLKLALTAVITTTLLACGGGGGDAPAPAPAPAATTDKYVGTWSACGKASATSTTSSKTTFVFVKTDATSLNHTVIATDYPAVGCTGTPSAPTTLVYNTVINGTKAVGDATVDTVISTPTDTSKAAFKQLLLVNGSSLQFGFAGTGATFDVNDYPNTLSAFTLTKQ